MRKTITVKSGLVALATILAVSGCSGNKQETTTQAKVYVSEEQVETEVTTTAVTEDTTETTTAAETTQTVQSGDVDFSTYTKVDEIYNTNFEPNMSDDIEVQIKFTNMDDDYNEHTYDVNFDDTTSYKDLLNVADISLKPIEYPYEISENTDDCIIEYCGVRHNLKERNTLTSSVAFELSDKNGNVVSDVSSYKTNELRVKAVTSIIDDNSAGKFSAPPQVSFIIKNSKGNEIEITAGNDYGNAVYELCEEGSMAICSSDKACVKFTSYLEYTVLKNSKYTIIIREATEGHINSISLINNNV